MPEPGIRLAHTAALSARELLSVRTLLDAAFEGAFTDEDFEHGLGGMHALAWDGAELVGHGSVVLRRLLHRGRAVRTGYVEAVGVRRDRRRRGHAGAVMAALEQVIRGGYELGALSASGAAADLYASRGWQRWAGTASVVTPHGLRRTAGEEDTLHVLPVTVDLCLDGDLACDWRNGDVW